MNGSNANGTTDLPGSTALLSHLRREALRASQEHGDNHYATRKAQNALTAAERHYLPDPADQGAVRAYLQQLKEDVRITRGENPGYGLDAWNLYFDESERLGRSLTALAERSPDEEVRFFAWVVYGSEGHAYWTGAKNFRGNTDKTALPRRWWWRREKGDLSSDILIKPGCGQPHCIAPDHQVESARGNRKWSENELLGKLQVLGMRLGRSPSRTDWTEAKMQPSEAAYAYYFGSWNKALVRAGLDANYKEFSQDECLRAIRHVRHQLGHWPTEPEFLSQARSLKQKGLPSSVHSLRRHYGTWVKARDAAKSIREEPQN